MSWPASRRVLTSLTIIALTLTPGWAAENKSTKPASVFNASDYPKETFKVSTRMIHQGLSEVNLIQVKPHSGDKPFVCRAWLSVIRDGHNANTRFWEHDNPYNSFSIMIPEKQPPHGLILVGSIGSFQLLLISDSGKLIETHGDEINGFFITSDGKYLINVQYTMDEDEAIVNLLSGKTRNINWHDKDLSMFAWYKDAKGYFFTAAHLNTDTWVENKDRIYRVNLETAKFVQEKANAETFSHAKKVPWDFTINRQADNSPVPECE